MGADSDNSTAHRLHGPPDAAGDPGQLRRRREREGDHHRRRRATSSPSRRRRRSSCAASAPSPRPRTAPDSALAQAKAANTSRRSSSTTSGWARSACRANGTPSPAIDEAKLAALSDKVRHRPQADEIAGRRSSTAGEGHHARRRSSSCSCWPTRSRGCATRNSSFASASTS